MANRERGEVPVKIDGETYTLRFSINECCDLEDAFGMTIIGIAEMMGTPEKFSIKMVRTLFWIGLKTNHTMEETDAGDLLSKTDINAVMAKVGEAFESAFPQAEGGDENPKTGPAAAGSGSTS